MKYFLDLSSIASRSVTSVQATSAESMFRALQTSPNGDERNEVLKEDPYRIYISV